MSKEWSAAGPESMRDRLAAYVHALHRAYLAQVEHLPPGERARMPLTAGAAPLTVVVAAARDLHIIATREPLPAPRGPEVELAEELPGLQWQVRFFDPSILPALGLVPAGEGAVTGVREVLGIDDVVYHLSIAPGGGLSEHHAQHAGVALANQHATAEREGQSLRAAWPGQAALVDEFLVVTRLGLPRLAGLLAQHIAGSRLTPEDLAGDLPSLRQALLRIGRGEE